MRVPALALTVRALRLDARSLRSALLRVAAVTFVLVALVYTESVSQFFGAPGQLLFGWLVRINFWLITLVGLSVFPTVITEEKEQMTLGMLTLAGFGPISILLGKGIGQLTTTLLIVLAQLPFGLLCVTLGGCSTHQVFAAFILLVSYMVLVFTIALVASVICKRSSRAIGWTALVLALWQIVAWILSAAGASFFGVTDWLVDISPMDRLGIIAQTGFQDTLCDGTVITYLITASLLFFLCLVTFSNINRQEWKASQARGWGPGNTKERGRPGTGVHALSWKTFYFVAGGPIGIFLRIVIYVVIIGLVATDAGGRGGLSRIAGPTLLWLALLFMLDGTWLASRIFKTEWRWHTLPALVTSPLSTSEICWATIRGAARVLIPVIILMALAGLACLGELDNLGGDGTLVAISITSLLISTTICSFVFAAYLSLVMTKGAMAVALAAHFLAYVVAQLFVFACAMGGPGTPVICGTMMILSGAFWGLSAIFFVRLKHRIRTKAAR